MKPLYLQFIMILSALSMFTGNAQNQIRKNTSCTENVLIRFDKTDGDYNTIELPQSIKNNCNWVNLKLSENLKDSIEEIYLDRTLFEIKDDSYYNIFYKYNKHKQGVKLFVKLLNDKGCLEILLDSHYNLAVLSRPNNQWELEYSGYYEINWKE